MLTSSGMKVTIQYFLNFIKVQNLEIMPAIVMSDCDQAQMNAIKAIYPECTLLLCWWHVLCVMHSPNGRIPKSLGTCLWLCKNTQSVKIWLLVGWDASWSHSSHEFHRLSQGELDAHCAPLGGVSTEISHDLSGGQYKYAYWVISILIMQEINEIAQFDCCCWPWRPWGSCDEVADNVGDQLVATVTEEFKWMTHCLQTFELHTHVQAQWGSVNPLFFITRWRSWVWVVIADWDGFNDCELGTFF